MVSKMAAISDKIGQINSLAFCFVPAFIYYAYLYELKIYNLASQLHFDIKNLC